MYLILEYSNEFPSRNKRRNFIISEFLRFGANDEDEQTILSNSNRSEIAVAPSIAAQNCEDQIDQLQIFVGIWQIESCIFFLNLSA